MCLDSFSIIFWNSPDQHVNSKTHDDHVHLELEGGRALSISVTKFDTCLAAW